MTPADTSVTPAPPPAPAASSGAPAKPKKEKTWAPRFWLGCDFFAWMRLLSRNRFAVEWRYLYIAVADTIFSVINTVLSWCVALLYGRGVARTEIKEHPIFVIGH
ncbi:MAG: hypothetical protein ACRESZ_03345 [Methylococcales bacterium]